MRLVVMGVAGSGKSTLGQQLAVRLGWPFLDADDLHTPEARAQMARGEPLRDADRWPWLERVQTALRSSPQGVVACSALRRIYRDALRGPGVRFLFLDVSEALLCERLAGRPGHFAGAALLPSQLATLERPSAQETDVLVLPVTAAESDGAVLERALRLLRGAP